MLHDFRREPTTFLSIERLQSRVGYNTYTMHAGYNIYTPTFESITAADKKLDLQDLKLANSEGWGTEVIWVLSEDGTAVTGHTYTWQCPDMSGADESCWIDDDTSAPAEGVSINEGDGFYIFCDGDDIDIQVAGSVKLGKFSHTMHPGYNLTGNFCPKSIDIQGVKLLNTEGWGTEVIWVLSDDGTAVTGHTYTWQCPDMSGADVACWIDDDTSAPAEGVSLVPGEGLYLFCDGDGVDIEIDPVLIKE